MTDAVNNAGYNGVTLYPSDMSPFKAGSLLFKVATSGSKDGKVFSLKQKKGSGKVQSKSKSKTGLSKSTVKTLTSISKK